MKLFYYDLETTGLDQQQNAIHQIAGEIEIDGKVVEQFNWKVRPHEGAVIEESALNIAGVTREEIMQYPEMDFVYEMLKGMMSKYIDIYDKQDKFHLIGYNIIAFDNPFLRAFFLRNGDKFFGSWFWSNSIDVMVLASNELRYERAEMRNFKLHTVAMHMGVEVDLNKLHDARYDIYLTKEIYKKLTLKYDTYEK